MTRCMYHSDCTDSSPLLPLTESSVRGSSLRQSTEQLQRGVSKCKDPSSSLLLFNQHDILFEQRLVSHRGMLCCVVLCCIKSNSICTCTSVCHLSTPIMRLFIYHLMTWHDLICAYVRRFSVTAYACNATMAYLSALFFQHIGGVVSAYSLNQFQRPWDWIPVS